MLNFSITPVVRNLIFLNVLVFMIDRFLLGGNLSSIFGLYYIFSPNFQVYQFVSYMFVHADFRHLFSNMLPVLLLGSMLERYFGPKRFLIFYMVTGIGAGFLHSAINFLELYNMQMAVDTYVTNPTPEAFSSFLRKYGQNLYGLAREFIYEFDNNPEDSGYIRKSIELVGKLFTTKANIPTVGASGSVFGVIVGFGIIFGNMTVTLFPLFIPVKAWVLATVLGLSELYFGINARPGDNIAHYAHIGGMIFAFILIKIWRGKGSGEFY